MIKRLAASALQAHNLAGIVAAAPAGLRFAENNEDLFADVAEVTRLLSGFGAELVDLPEDGACQFHLMARQV